MQKNRHENNPPELRRNQKSRGNRDAVEKGVDQQADQHRVAFVSVNELVGVRFFSKVEVRRDRVLKEMDEQVSAKNKKPGVGAPQLNALRHHFDERRCQHKTCAQRDEIAQVGTLPISLHNDGAAEHIRARRRQPQQHAGQDGRHEGKE